MYEPICKVLIYPVYGLMPKLFMTPNMDPIQISLEHPKDASTCQTACNGGHIQVTG